MMCKSSFKNSFLTLTGLLPPFLYPSPPPQAPQLIQKPPVAQDDALPATPPAASDSNHSEYEPSRPLIRKRRHPSPSTVRSQKKLHFKTMSMTLLPTVTKIPIKRNLVEMIAVSNRGCVCSSSITTNTMWEKCCTPCQKTVTGPQQPLWSKFPNRTFSDGAKKTLTLCKGSL